MKGKLFVLSAPAGTGKTTLVKKLTSEFEHVVQSISYTSRNARPNEIDGKDYHFVTKEQFRKKLDSGDFLEHAVVYEDLYGTDAKRIDTLLESGKDVFLVIDTQGALQVMEKRQCVSIFVFPPSSDALKERLEKRGTEDEEVIAERLDWSRDEMDKANHYRYHIVNDNFDAAYDVLRSIVIAEDHKQE